ncbi:MAG TPA: hypothetical protein VF618_05315 [Thermoanaerobaculia bacterium]
MKRLPIPLIVALVLVASQLLAFDVRRKEELLDAKVKTLPPLKVNFDATKAQLYLLDPVWRAWNQSHGGNWTAQLDSLTGKPRRVLGGAIPWSGDLEQHARQFIDANRGLIGVGNERLTFVPIAANAVRSGRVRYAAFDYSINGVPVEHGRLVFAVNNGNMIYWHSANIANVPAITTPTITAAQALTNVLGYTALLPSQIAVVDEPSLKLIPRNTASLLTYQLVYQLRFRLAGGRATWGVTVDALTGAILAFADTNRYADCQTATTGKVTGGIRPAQASDEEVVRSFPFVDVEAGNATAPSTLNGTFPYSGGPTATRLNGTFFDTNCEDCVKSETDPQSAFQPFAQGVNGRISLGTGGRDVLTTGQPTIAYGNGTSTPADRTAFFHTNVARAIALKWLDLPWLHTKVPVKVNINDVCNAFWDGTALNFFKGGELTSTTGSAYKCANTGEIRDVMQHEWGHGLDDNDGEDPGYAAGLGDMATGEAAADYIALFVDHDSCVGQSFYNRFTGPFITDPDVMSVAMCDGVRNVDEHRATTGILTATNVTQKCAAVTTAPYYIGPLLGEGHCEGELWGQAGWHLVHNLMTGRKYGTVKLDANKQHVTYAGDPLPGDNPAFDRDAAWTLLERLYFESRPIVASYAPTRYQAMGPSAYDGFLIADDEGDGLANGTPHAAYINDAYVHHGIEEWAPLAPNAPMVADAKNCATLAAPSVTTTAHIDGSTGSPAVTVSWTPVAGAASYSVLRNERRHDVFLEVARLTNGTSFTDAGVDNGVTYHYRVQANGAGSCFTTSGTVKTTAVSLPDAFLKSVVITDSPKGNADGTLDAGEQASLFIVIGNQGIAGLTNVNATMSTLSSGVAVTKPGPRAFGSIGAGAAVGQPFAVTVDPNGALCGTIAQLVLNITSDQGCFSIAVPLQIGDAGASCYVYKRAAPTVQSLAITSDKLGACGDGDNTPDPRETVQVTVAVSNNGDRPASDVRVRLSSDKNYLSIANDTASVGALAPLGSETKTVTFAVVVGSAPHADLATLTATVSWSGSTVSSTRALTTVVNRDLVTRTLAYTFDAGPEGWLDTGGGWHRTTALTTGNQTPLWQSAYTADRCDSLVSPAVELTSSSTLSFDLAYVSENTDAAYDGTDVQVSLDGGRTWTTVELTQGYSAASGGTTCITAGAPMFSGVSPLMQRYDADLSAFAGKTAQFRFRFASDPMVDAMPLGVWVDNVTVKDATVSIASVGCN